MKLFTRPQPYPLVNVPSPLAPDHKKAQTPSSAMADRPSKNRRWPWVGAVLILTGGLLYTYTEKVKPGAAQPGLTAKKGGGAVPVLAAAAVKGDIGVYLPGLGSVTPLYNVTLRSRVDGQLMKVLFTEGQLVKEGDLLAEIDPRPYQVQVAQAEGQLIRDEAELKNSRLDLERNKALWAQRAIPEQLLFTQEATVTQHEGTVKSDQAQLDSAKLNLAYSHITAPINGRVGLRQ